MIVVFTKAFKQSSQLRHSDNCNFIWNFVYLDKECLALMLSHFAKNVTHVGQSYCNAISF